jgi:hypothetical protein
MLGYNLHFRNTAALPQTAPESSCGCLLLWKGLYMAEQPHSPQEAGTGAQVGVGGLNKDLSVPPTPFRTPRSRYWPGNTFSAAPIPVLEFWIPNKRNQGKQAHPVLKYRVPHGSQPRPRVLGGVQIP